MGKITNLPYAHPARLADVMALLQVLSLHRFTERSDKGLADTMQGPPRSAATWEEIAQEHREFFRVDPEAKLGVSLVARYVLPRDEKGARALSLDFATVLLRAAIDVHDRQWERAQEWKKSWMPIVHAVVTGILAIAGVVAGVLAS